jgi:hypothetical protein
LNFDLWNLAAEAVRQSKTMIGIYDLIERSVLIRLPSIVEGARKADPVGYARWLTGVPVTSIAFASFENGIPQVVSVNFRIDSRGTILKPERQTMGGTKAADLEDLFFGTNKQMIAATDPNAALTWGRKFLANPVDFIRGLIQLEIDVAARDHTGIVGPPITILSITRAGGHFEAGFTGACQ